jgi:hypothetical protein
MQSDDPKYITITFDDGKLSGEKKENMHYLFLLAQIPSRCP